MTSCGNNPLRRGALAALALLFAMGGCSGGGCGGLAPLPQGHYSGPKTDNAVSVRLSGDGISWVNSNWPQFVEALAPGGKFSVQLPCSVQDVASIGEVLVADQGALGCTDEACGQMDGRCDSKDVPAALDATISSFSVVPRSPDLLEAVVEVTLATDQIKIDTRNRNHPGCLMLSPVKCALEFNTSLNDPPGNRFRAKVQFAIDTRWDKLLDVTIAEVSGTQICDSAGAPEKPECLDPKDLELKRQNSCGNYCEVAGWNPLKVLVLKQLSPSLQVALRKALARVSCTSCEQTSSSSCPQSTDGAATQAVCRNLVCTDPSTGKCVPAPLGAQGRIPLGEAMASLGVPPDAFVDLSAAAGSAVAVDRGISFGSRVGMKEGSVASCVPPAAPPTIGAVDSPQFDLEAAPESQYHVGLALSSDFLNLALHSIHQAGGFCLNTGMEGIALLDTGLLKTFLPSLGRLATRDGSEAPMLIALRPQRPPTATVGLGTTDGETKKPLKPLLTLAFVDFAMDFYALLEDRFVRLFTLTADVSVPLGLIFEGCDKATPVVGDLKAIVSNIRSSNSEMLSEDPKALGDLIPVAIGLVEPAVAGGLASFGIPKVGPFKLKVTEAKGLGNVAGTDRYQHLGLYAQLLPADSGCAPP